MFIYKIGVSKYGFEEDKPKFYLEHDVAVKKFYDKFYQLQLDLLLIGEDDDPEYGDVAVWTRKSTSVEDDILLEGIINYWVDGTTPECGEEWYISHVVVTLEKIEAIE